MGAALTMTPADILKYQSELVRTGKGLPLGRMIKIAIGPSDDFRQTPADGFIKKYGRLIDLRDRFLPIAQSADRTMILVTAPLRGRDGRVGLPDVPDPEWVAPPRSKEEMEGVERVHNGRKYRISPGDKDPYTGQIVPGVDVSRYKARMLPQLLRDRTDVMLEGTNFLIFAPVVHIAFQPELGGELAGTVWTIDCLPNPADRTLMTLLVDERTGETHFFGGLFDIRRPGEESNSGE